MHWRYGTALGTVQIRYTHHQYLVTFNNVLIGVYSTLPQALAGIETGELKAPPLNRTLAELGVPADIERWVRLEPPD